jgi:hypothetical protein
MARSLMQSGQVSVEIQDINPQHAAALLEHLKPQLALVGFEGARDSLAREARPS